MGLVYMYVVNTGNMYRSRNPRLRPRQMGLITYLLRQVSQSCSRGLTAGFYPMVHLF